MCEVLATRVGETDRFVVRLCIDEKRLECTRLQAEKTRDQGSEQEGGVALTFETASAIIKGVLHKELAFLITMSLRRLAEEKLELTLNAAKAEPARSVFKIAGFISNLISFLFEIFFKRKAKDLLYHRLIYSRLLLPGEPIACEASVSELENDDD